MYLVGPFIVLVLDGLLWNRFDSRSPSKSTFHNLRSVLSSKGFKEEAGLRRLPHMSREYSVRIPEGIAGPHKSRSQRLLEVEMEVGALHPVLRHRRICHLLYTDRTEHYSGTYGAGERVDLYWLRHFLHMRVFSTRFWHRPSNQDQ